VARSTWHHHAAGEPTQHCHLPQLILRRMVGRASDGFDHAARGLVIWSLQNIRRSCTITYVQALQKWSLREFQSSYTDEPEFELRAIPIILSYAPSKTVYDNVETFWKTIWHDLAAHYLSAVGDSSAPSQRNNGNWCVQQAGTCMGEKHPLSMCCRSLTVA